MSARGQYGRVPVAPIREAFRTSGATPYELAMRLDWSYDGITPDSYRVCRALGLKPYPVGHGYPAKCREFVSVPVALMLLDAMGVFPAEVGM